MKSLRWIIGWGLGLFFLIWFFSSFFDAGQARELLKRADGGSLVLTLLCFLIAVGVRVVKWAYLVRINDKNLSWRAGWHTVMIANLANFVLPVRAGELLKPYLAKRLGHVPYTCSISATIMDRFWQLLIMMLFLLLIPFAGFVFVEQTVHMGILTFAGVALIVLFCYGIKVLSLFEKSLPSIMRLLNIERSRTASFFTESVSPFVRNLFEKMTIGQFHKEQLLLLVLLSVLIVSVDGLCYLLIMHAFGVSITLLQGMVASCLMGFAFILPSPPAQLGAAEMYPVIIFSWGLGLPADAVATVSLSWHFLTIVTVIVLGVVSSLATGINYDTLRNYQKSN